MNNFLQGIQALTNDIGLFFSTLFSNSTITGFGTGIIVSTIVTGFILTKDPRRIPLILRYSSAELFQKINPQAPNGVYRVSFLQFLKLYTLIRILFLIAMITFFIMVITITLSYERQATL